MVLVHLRLEDSSKFPMQQPNMAAHRWKHALDKTTVLKNVPRVRRAAVAAGAADAVVTHIVVALAAAVSVAVERQETPANLK